GLRTHQDDIQFIQVRHEEAAAFAACGHAKFTGKLGVCLATSGPGGIHLLNGLYDAKCDGQPVLAITGHTFHDLIGTHYQQDVDLTKLFMDVAVYNERIAGPAHIHNAVDEAIRCAFARRGPAHVCIPKDMQEWTASGIGLLGTAPSQEAMQACDTLVILGSNFPYMEFLPKPGRARGVQIDVDATRIGLRYPAEVGLVGDCQRILEALLPLIERKPDRSFLESAQKGMKDWNELMEQRGTRTDVPMKPQVVAYQVNKLLN